MARNDGMDALSALIGLGILRALTPEQKNTSVSGGIRKPSHQEGANAAKAIYDSYVEVGFNEVQAFELLKLVLSK